MSRAGAAATPGRLEGAVRRAIERRPPGRTGGTADVSVIRVRLERGSAAGPDQVGAAVAEAIGAAMQRRGAGR